MPRMILDVRLYSVQEISDLLAVTPATVCKYIKNGQLEARTIGGKRYIAEASLKKFLLGEK